MRRAFQTNLPCVPSGLGTPLPPDCKPFCDTSCFIVEAHNSPKGGLWGRRHTYRPTAQGPSRFPTKSTVCQEMHRFIFQFSIRQELHSVSFRFSIIACRRRLRNIYFSLDGYLHFYFRVSHINVVEYRERSEAYERTYFEFSSQRLILGPLNPKECFFRKCLYVRRQL